MLKRLIAILFFLLIAWGTVLPQNIPIVIDLSVNQNSPEKIVMVKLQLLPPDRKNLWQYYVDSTVLVYNKDGECIMQDTILLKQKPTGRYALHLTYRYSHSEPVTADYSFKAIDTLPNIGIQIFLNQRIHKRQDYKIELLGNPVWGFRAVTKLKPRVLSTPVPMLIVTHCATQDSLVFEPLLFGGVRSSVRPQAYILNNSQKTLFKNVDHFWGITNILDSADSWIEYFFAGRCGTGSADMNLGPHMSTTSDEGWPIGDVQALVPGFYRYRVNNLHLGTESVLPSFYFDVIYSKTSE